MACCGVGSAATAAAIRSGPDGGRDPTPLCQGGVLRTFAWALPRGPLQAVLWQAGDQLFAWASRLHNAAMRWLQPEPSEGEAWMLSMTVLEQFVEGLPREATWSAVTSLG